MDIKTAAKEHLLAAARFDRAWVGFWKEVEPLADDRFFLLLPLFQSEIERFRFRYQRTDGVDSAAREIYRKTVTGESKGRYTFEEALRFAKAYSHMSNRVGRALDRVVEETSDDGYSDLCDALPLAGEEIIKRALASHPKSERPRREGFLDNAELEEALQGLGEEWNTLIRRGENYVRAALERQARHYWLYLVRTGEDRADWSDEEQSLLSLGGIPE